MCRQKHILTFYPVNSVDYLLDEQQTEDLLMIEVHSDIIEFKGTHYDFGYKQGAILRDSPILKHRKKQWKNKQHHFLINKQTYRDVIFTFAPRIWDELLGLADALKWPIDNAIREFGGYYLEYGRSGCSIFTTKKYMIRNYDNHPDSYEGRYVIFNPTEEGYATIGPTMQITGRTDGMNEKGLAMGYNFINRRGSEDGFLCNMIGRIILETCANVDEAIELLKAIPHRHSFSYILLDPSGDTYIVEASPRKVAVRQGNICTNHFEQVTEENRFRMDDSFNRHKAITSQMGTIENSYAAFKMMNDSDKGVYSNKYGAWAGTLHTAAYFPKEMKVGFAIGGDRNPLIFDFNQLLDNENMKVKKIKGILDTTTPFINVE